MVEGLAEWSQYYKTGKCRHDQGKFEEDSWYNAKLEITRSELSLGALAKEFQ